MRNVHGRTEKVVTGAGVDVMGLEASLVEGGVRTTKVELGIGGSELERKHTRVNSTRANSVVEEGVLFKIRDGRVRQTHQAKTSFSIDEREEKI